MLSTGSEVAFTLSFFAIFFGALFALETKKTIVCFISFAGTLTALGAFVDMFLTYQEYGTQLNKDDRALLFFTGGLFIFGSFLSAGLLIATAILESRAPEQTDKKEESRESTTLKDG